MAFETDLRDARFILFEQLDIDRLLRTPRYRDIGRDMFDMILAEADKVAKGVLAPMNKHADEVGAIWENGEVRLPEGFKAAWKIFSEGGWIGLTGGAAYGGQGLPITLRIAVDEMFMAACTAFHLTCGLSASAASVIEEFADDEARNLFLEKMYAGRWGATMCLTEPDAGSALGGIRTQAVKIEGTHNRYKIYGDKMFITSGDQDLTENIVHLVLAKVPGAPSGTRGISLFIVPKFRVNADGSMGPRNDVACSRIEHKMGIRASATCSLTFGDAGACEGILIGEENNGLRYMFRMMNEERIEVGVQGTGIASAAYHYALNYARERLQSPSWKRLKEKDAPNVPIIEHPDVRRMLLWQRSHVEGMRALLLATAWYSDMSHASEDEAERARCAGFVELLTPICKSYCTDRGFESAVTAIQCLGGYGYTSEYDAEQYARDAKIGSIYEGTNAIQAIDFIGRKVPMKGGAIFKAYMDLIGADLARMEGHAKLAPYAKMVAEAKDLFVKTLMGMAGAKDDDGLLALLQATGVTSMMGDLCVSHLLLTQADLAYEKIAEAFAKAGAADDAAKNRLIEEDDRLKYLYGKTRAAKFFITQVLPNLHARARAISTRDTSPMDPIW